MERAEALIVAWPRHARQLQWECGEHGVGSVLTAEEKESLRMQPCPDWPAVREACESFPAPCLEDDSQGEPVRTTWVFRDKSDKYDLKPSIERVAEQKSKPWAALESELLEEFHSKARMYVDPSQVPPVGERLSWLAFMQHYRVPTRLLDFSYSPYIALYFALRQRTETEQQRPAEVWAIDANVVLEWARRVSAIASRAGSSDHLRPLSNEDFASDREVLERERMYWDKVNSDTLDPSRIHREVFNNEGFVTVALPPVQNQRLSSQQGVFLFNGAEDRTFEDSLLRMMPSDRRRWCKIIQVPAVILEEVERKLFQMNVHELSLFPDLEGLAGSVQQKIRWHWWPR